MNIVHHFTIIAKFKRFVIQNVKLSLIVLIKHFYFMQHLYWQNTKFPDKWHKLKKTFLKTLREREIDLKFSCQNMNKFEFTIYPNYSEKDVSLCDQNVFEKDLIIPKQNVKNICQSYTCKYWSTVQN